MDEIRPGIYRFGPFEIDLDQRLLLRAGDSVPLTPKAFDTLAVLVARQGKLVDKAELLRLVWPDTFVEENNLTQNISTLRKVLGEGAWIETIPRRGYRFLMTVEGSAVAPTAPAAPPARHPTAVPRSRFPWIRGCIAVTAIATLAFFVAQRSRTSPRPDRYVDSLVVLPFVNLTADPQNDFFSDGLTEELTNALAHLDGLRVVARTTAFQFKGKARDIRAIARQLRVGAVLEGSVRLQDKKLRVTVQLNDAQTGYHLWSQTFNRDSGDLLGIEEDISSQVAHTVRPNSVPVRAATGSRDLEAYNLYLLGRFYRRRPDGPSIKKAIGLFQQAIQMDPRYAAAWAGLAECYMLLAQEDLMPPMEAWASARNAADKALALDDNLAEAHTTQAIVYLLADRNWGAAEHHFRRALALNANDASAHHWFSHYLIAMSRIAESRAESQRALELDPLDVQISGHQSWHYVYAHDYPNAIKAGLQTLELDPHAQLAFNFLSWAYENTAQWDKAIDAFQHAVDFHFDPFVLRTAVQVDGAQGYWRSRLEFLSKQKMPENFRLAVVYARLGQSDKSLDRLERALQMHETNVIYVKREPAFEGMQTNPRFKALADEMKLP